MLLNTTTGIAELDIFIKGLTCNSIDHAIACFRDAISTCQVLPGDFDPRQAEKTCSHILDQTADGSIMMENIHKVPKFWVNLEGLAHKSNLNSLESYITCVFCMRGALILHHWLLDVVQLAVQNVNNASCNTWIDRLSWDVDIAIGQKKTMIFESENYLPHLQHPHTFSFIPKNFLLLYYFPSHFLLIITPFTDALYASLFVIVYSYPYTIQSPNTALLSCLLRTLGIVIHLYTQYIQLLALDSSCLIYCYSCTQPCSSILQCYINVPRNRLWALASRHVTNIIFNYNVQFNSNLR